MVSTRRCVGRKHGTRSQVSLEGPLGAGGVQITADGDTLSIVNSHGDHLDSDAARAELAARLGFDPPLSSLRYWILGVPDPGMPAKENSIRSSSGCRVSSRTAGRSTTALTCRPIEPAGRPAGSRCRRK